VNLTHTVIEGLDLSTGLANPLEFTLGTVEDVVESKTTVFGWEHAITHATVEVERVAGTGGRG